MTVLVLLYGFSVLLLVISLVWILVPALYGLPPVATRPERIRRALELVQLQKGETMYDLGAGDGRVLFMAAREFGAQAVGLEIGPVQCALIGLRARLRGFAADQVRVQWGNFYHAGLQAADVVFVYATSREVTRLAPHLEKQMRPGARLVSISADFPEWEPALFDERELIFVYGMPPTPGSLTTYLLKAQK